MSPTAGRSARCSREVESELGPVDVFFANAGVAIGEDPVDTPGRGVGPCVQRQRARPHPRGAALLPGWLERGEGYFVTTASAAGLLTQIGSAPYAVTKHAAVAFAEWLSVTYGDRGIRVSCLCPMGVRTAMLQGEELSHRVVKAAGAVLEPEDSRRRGHRRDRRRAVPDPAPSRGADVLPAQGDGLRPVARRDAAVAIRAVVALRPPAGGSKPLRRTTARHLENGRGLQVAAPWTATTLYARQRGSEAARQRGRSARPKRTCDLIAA